LLILELSPQLNRSLECMRDLGSYVSSEGLQFLSKKLHYERFAVLIHLFVGNDRFNDWN